MMHTHMRAAVTETMPVTSLLLLFAPALTADAKDPSNGWHAYVARTVRRWGVLVNADQRLLAKIQWNGRLCAQAWSQRPCY